MGNPNSGRRPGYRHLDSCREKIKVSQTINRLQKLVNGDITGEEMPPHAVTAALGLLRKVLPDMASVEHTGDVAERYVIETAPKVANVQEWLKQYTEKPPLQ